MRVRIIQLPAYISIWNVQIWRWWWSVWVTVGYAGEAEARKHAQVIKHPRIEEIK